MTEREKRNAMQFDPDAAKKVLKKSKLFKSLEKKVNNHLKETAKNNKKDNKISLFGKGTKLIEINELIKIRNDDWTEYNDLWRSIDPKTPSYRSTIWWKSFSKWFRTKYQTKCQCCGCSNSQIARLSVHHMSYYRIAYNEHLHLEYLQTLCRRCHQNWHKENGIWIHELDKEQIKIYKYINNNKYDIEDL